MKIKAHNSWGSTRVILTVAILGFVGASSASGEDGYEFITKWGSAGSGDEQFNHPMGIAVDSSGYVYVVDYGNDRIQKFESSDGINYTLGVAQGMATDSFMVPIVLPSIHPGTSMLLIMRTTASRSLKVATE